MKFYIPPLTPVPPNATIEQRRALHRQAVAELVQYNPHMFLPPGVRKRWWHLWKREYPEVLL